MPTIIVMNLVTHTVIEKLCCKYCKEEELESRIQAITESIFDCDDENADDIELQIHRAFKAQLNKEDGTVFLS
jgi:hypothetical protein